MALLMRITDDMKLAMKARDNATLSTLRFLLSAVKNKKIDVQHELSDEETQDVIKTQVKQLKDSIVSFESGSRSDLIASARVEIEILTRYLPEQLSDEALEVLVKDTITQTGAASKDDMGRVMGACVKAAQGKADGARIKEIVARMLPVVVLMVVLGLAGSVHAASIPLMQGGDIAQEGGTVEMGLRLMRVLVLWFGIGAITLIINGAFQYMTNAKRDDERFCAMGKITQGIFITIIVAAVFAVSTVYLQKLY
jgi:uncharacterized protein YqeY